MRFFIALGLLLLSVSAFCQIHISTNQTWSSDTVLVNEDIVIDPLVILTISPGTVVLFGPQITMTVDGLLKAEGTENSPIIFDARTTIPWGGIQITSSSFNCTFKFCKFYRSRQSLGGAINVNGQRPITISDCDFLFNTAEKGGALYFSYFVGDCTVSRCLIARNNAGSGGGVFMDIGCSVGFVQNTVTANKAINIGGLYSNGSAAAFYNNIIWGNEGSDFIDIKTEPNRFPAYLRHSIIGNANFNNPNVGVRNVDPIFKDPQNLDYTLTSSSPAIDNGCYCILDSDGSRSDIGCRPFVKTSPGLDYILVDSLSARNATLANKVIPYVVCTNLKVKQGELLVIKEGVAVIFAERTVIDVYGTMRMDGTLSDSIMLTAIDTSTYYMPAWEGKKRYGWGGIRVFDGGNFESRYSKFERFGFTGSNLFMDGSLKGFNGSTISLDHANFNGHVINAFSGAPGIVQGDHASIYIRDCVFGNTRGKGSILYMESSSLSVENSRFENNSFMSNQYRGSVIYGSNSTLSCKKNTWRKNVCYALLDLHAYKQNLTVDENRFVENEGMMWLSNLNPGVQATLFRNNYYARNNGEIYFESGIPVITGNVFTNNTYQNFQINSKNSLIYAEHCDPIIANNTITNNINRFGVAISVWGGRPKVVNNIIYNNSLGNFVENAFSNDDGRVYQNNIQNETMAGAGNTTKNPRFRLNTTEKFLIDANSPAIGGGTSSYTQFLLPTDIVGNPRINGVLDIGAIEFTGSRVALNDIHLSDTVIERSIAPQGFVSLLITNATFDNTQLAFSFVNDLGYNNDYFIIDNNRLLLRKAISWETLLRVKIRATHVSGAWLEQSFYLTVEKPIITGMELREVIDIHIYPNPARAVIYVDGVRGDAPYIIYSSSGVAVNSGTISYSREIATQELPAGLYSLVINEDGKRYVKKFVKE
jgi:hypothetical protein